MDLYLLLIEEEIETRRSLLPGKTSYETPSHNLVLLRKRDFMKILNLFLFFSSNLIVISTQSLGVYGIEIRVETTYIRRCEY